MNTSLSPDQYDDILARLGEANRAFNAAFPGDAGDRQPVHTVYGGAHLFKADTAIKMGRVALRSMQTYAPTFVDLARALDWEGCEGLPREKEQMVNLQTRLMMRPMAMRQEDPLAWRAHQVYHRVVDKLKREPVEDFRIDFEDGFGNRPDDEEDAEAMRTAEEVAGGFLEDTLPPFIGIRIKPLTEDLKGRALRTLDLFLTTLLNWTDGRLPAHFVVTLPKVTHPAQVRALAETFAWMEAARGLPPETLKMELMVETPQSLVSSEGSAALPRLVAAARGRCVAAHFGVYDYTALLNITAAHQSMIHPACDFARQMMQVSLSGTGIRLSDGATNVMPVGPHREVRGAALSDVQARENREAVHHVWRLNAAHIRHSLVNGFYQGWDLHPAQLPVRYATVYAFFLEGFEEAALRLKNFMDKAAQATLVGDIFDDAATGQALLNYFLRAINCGAVTEEEACTTGLTIDELRSRSFYRILEGRRRTSP